jgi:hypothetical protein
MDMLRKCRDTFKLRAVENRAYSDNSDNLVLYRTAAAYMADENERLAREIDATLKEWS